MVLVYGIPKLSIPDVVVSILYAVVSIPDVENGHQNGVVWHKTRFFRHSIWNTYHCVDIHFLAGYCYFTALLLYEFFSYISVSRLIDKPIGMTNPSVH